MPLIHDHFLLHTDAARRLYHAHAIGPPILDYHCHLAPRDIAENRRFANLFEIWLEGDHYKWRAMRSAGVPEPYCTGDAEPKEKFLAWARTVPQTLRNPLYHWTHLELKRYFDIDALLSENTAEQIWSQANEALADEAFSAWGILERFRVKAVCTTDDPADSLEHHRAIAQSDLATLVYPTFRPDQALAVHAPAAFNAWLARLEQATDLDIDSYALLIDALSRRHAFFHQMGCRLSDHGLSHCYADFCTDAAAEAIFAKARSGTAATPEEFGQFASNLMLHFGRLDAEKGWTKQLHLGPRRNNSTRRFEQLGPDTGFDSMGDWPQIEALAGYLDRLDRENALPQTIVYNLNPVHNYAFAAMLGNFQDGSRPGKMQLGSGWWFLDQKEGMQWQINAISNVGLLSQFVGMLTDSRSFMSYPRHEYFRRVLCDVIGRDVQQGELPDDDEMLGELIRNLCYDNARRYFGFDL